MTSTAAPALGSTTERPSRSSLAQFTANALYLLTAWPLMLVAFILVVVLVAVGTASAVLWVGVPLLVCGVVVARGFATFQRRAAVQLRGHQEPDVRYPVADPDASVASRMLLTLRDTQSWLDVVWVVVGFVVSTITWSVALVWLVGAAGTVLGPLSVLVLDGSLGAGYQGVAQLLGLSHPLLWDMVIEFAAGLFFLLTARAVLAALVNVQLDLGDALLTSHARDRARVEQLSRSRDAARQAESQSLRRLERDIHDGPQQRLVRVQMDLARARRQQDPEAADAIIAGAMEQTQQTLAELRQLSRGIAPPVLVDRGLEAAVVEAAARSSVPVQVAAELPPLPPHVENAAYFVASECLANLNKHSQATSASIEMVVRDGLLHVGVHDDGVGGANLSAGHGLAGLEQRVHGVDGQLHVTSPLGGPTTVEAVIPCGS